MKARTSVLIIIIVGMIIGLTVYLSLSLSSGASKSEKDSEERVEAADAPVEEREIDEEQTDDKSAAAVEHEETKAENNGTIKSRVVVAWQPSHQDDTGDASWHEYIICNDIVVRAMSLCTVVTNVKCWDTSHGLTGTNNYRPRPTNTVAFDVEIAMANQAGADYFISVHNDGGAPSGILGLCMPGDLLSRSYAERFVDVLCARTGLPKRGIWEVRLYSLEPERNRCPVRLLLEIGDNQKDRALLESEQFRQLVAQALAEVVNTLPDQR